MMVACLAGVSADINHQKKNQMIPSAPTTITDIIDAASVRKKTQWWGE